MIRLFVALGIPETLHGALSLLEGGVPGARWSRPDQWHLTLRFIGEVDEREAQDIDDALMVLRAPSFTLELAGVGEFGAKNPHMLWAGIRSSDALLHLQRKVETALQRLGLTPEPRKFTPHVTLARLRGSPNSKVAEWIAARALFAAPPFEVENFGLYSSQLSPGGSIYRLERDYALTR